MLRVTFIDEVGYLTYGPDAANVLFHVVNERHLRKRLMVFTTNKPLSESGEVLHDEDLAAAIQDRVLERGRFIHLDRPSGRTRHLNLDEVLPTNSERVRISGIHNLCGSIFRTLRDGTIRHPQRSRVLVRAEGPYRTKKAAQSLADEFLKPLNNGSITASSGMTLKRLVEDFYLPFAERQKRPSTCNGYRKIWKRYLEFRSDRALRDYRTVDIEQVLNAIRARSRSDDYDALPREALAQRFLSIRHSNRHTQSSESGS